MEGPAERLGAPDHGLGVEWLSDAGREAQRRKVIASGQLGPGPHQHADRGRRSVPDGDLLLLQDPVPAVGIELGLVHDHGDAIGERGDDAIGGAGHPAGVGGAPEDVIRVQVENIFPGHVMHDDCAMDMDGALGPARGAAGEVEERRILGFRAHRREAALFISQGLRQGDRAGRGGIVDDQHLLQRGQPLPPALHLLAVEGAGGDQQLCSAQAHAGLDGLRAKGGEQG